MVGLVSAQADNRTSKDLDFNPGSGSTMPSEQDALTYYGN